ncbi:hypothetical protein [Desulforhopalus singaporensis]|uniref:Uncharacterized protein n=1 Tax=Desulforhopalus singaporensis TaxID=91360 RepID=A0A1H0NR45_9BACT|nr:hypothetical protein [Desulforhopalus singaporensis]SDO94925.1 hypothetical protein SAMN05660330_01403 [Desulforhopalus singaporensis]
MTPEKKIEDDIFESVKCSELVELGKIATETGIDSLLDNGLLRDIPIINTLSSLIRTGFQINDRIFIKKVIKFLLPISKLSDVDRKKMIDRLNSKKEFRNKVGERLVEILSRIESHKKPTIIGKIFCSYINEQIDFLVLRKLLFAVERIPYYEISNLREFQSKSKENSQNIYDYIDIDLLVSSGFASPISAWDGMLYKPTKLCNIFLDLEFDKD